MAVKLNIKVHIAWVLFQTFILDWDIRLSETSHGKGPQNAAGGLIKNKAGMVLFEFVENKLQQL